MTRVREWQIVARQPSCGSLLIESLGGERNDRSKESCVFATREGWIDPARVPLPRIPPPLPMLCCLLGDPHLARSAFLRPVDFDNKIVFISESVCPIGIFFRFVWGPFPPIDDAGTASD